MMAESLERWLREEMEAPPSAIPSPAALRRLCSGPTAPIWDYVIRHVRNERNVKKIRGNLRWYGHLQELEPCAVPPGRQGALRAALGRLRKELRALGAAIEDGQETAQRLEAALGAEQSRRWAELQRGAELRLLGAELQRGAELQLLGAEPGPPGGGHQGALGALHKRPGPSRAELSAILASGAEPEVLVSIKALCQAREAELRRPRPHRAANHPREAQEAPDWLEQAEAVLIGHSPGAVLWALEALANQSTRDLLAGPAPSAEAPPTLRSLLQERWGAVGGVWGSLPPLLSHLAQLRGHLGTHLQRGRGGHGTTRLFLLREGLSAFRGSLGRALTELQNPQNSPQKPQKNPKPPNPQNSDPKSPDLAPKSAPKSQNSAPKSSDLAPKSAPSLDSKSPNLAPKSPNLAPNLAPNSAPKSPNLDPKFSDLAPKSPSLDPKFSSLDPKSAPNLDPKSSSLDPKSPNSAPKSAPNLDPKSPNSAPNLAPKSSSLDPKSAPNSAPKSPNLAPKSSNLNPNPAPNLAPKSSSFDPNSASNLAPKSSSLDPKSSNLDPNSAANLAPKSSNLNPNSAPNSAPKSSNLAPKSSDLASDSAPNFVPKFPNLDPKSSSLDPKSPNLAPKLAPNLDPKFSNLAPNSAPNFCPKSPNFAPNSPNLALERLRQRLRRKRGRVVRLQQRLRFLSAASRGRRAALRDRREQVLGVARAGPGSAPPPLEGAWLRRRQLAVGGALGAEPRPPEQATPPLQALAREMGVAQGSLLSRAAILKQQLRQGAGLLRRGAWPAPGAGPEPPAPPPPTEGVAELLPRLRLVSEGCQQRIRDWPRLRELLSQWWAQPAQWALATPSGHAPFSHWLQRWRAAAHALQATPTPEEAPPSAGKGAEPGEEEAPPI